MRTLFTAAVSVVAAALVCAAARADDASLKSEVDALKRQVAEQERKLASLDGRAPTQDEISAAVTAYIASAPSAVFVGGADGGKAGFPLGKKLVLGVGLLAPQAARDAFPEDGAQRYSLVSTNGTAFVILEAALGYRVSEKLHLGVGLQNGFSFFRARTVMGGCPGETICAPEDPSFDALGEIEWNDLFNPSAVVGVRKRDTDVRATLDDLWLLGSTTKAMTATLVATFVEQGALYPALARLEHQGLLEGEWGTSDNNRRAKFYRLTAAGRRRLKSETDRWSRLAVAMSRALSAQEV